MAILSRKTCGLAIELMNRGFTKAKLELLLYKYEVNQNLLEVQNKDRMLRLVFQQLEEKREYDRILGIIHEAMVGLPPEHQKQLQGALIRDGFVATNANIVPDETRAEENKTALEQLVGKHAAKMTSATLLHHLKEAEELFRLEKWDASIGQARNFVEQLLLDIASATAKARQEMPELGAPVKVRNYLQTAGFFDEAERKKLVDGVYGYFSEEGAHPGIGVQSTARACLSVLWTFGFYVLEKFDTWPV